MKFNLSGKIKLKANDRSQKKSFVIISGNKIEEVDREKKLLKNIFDDFKKRTVVNESKTFKKELKTTSEYVEEPLEAFDLTLSNIQLEYKRFQTDPPNLQNKIFIFSVDLIFLCSQKEAVEDQITIKKR